ncbi:hypothetical protein Peur_005397 [Populus x canadensis]
MVTLVKETSAIFVLTKNGMASKSQSNIPQTPFSQSLLRLHVTHCATHSIGHGIQHRSVIYSTPLTLHYLLPGPQTSPTSLQGHRLITMSRVLRPQQTNTSSEKPTGETIFFHGGAHYGDLIGS